MRKTQTILRHLVITSGILFTQSIMANDLTCKAITNKDLFIPKNVVDYTSKTIEVSQKFGLPEGSIYVKATKANTLSTGKFRVSRRHHITFTISGNQPVYIKAIHGGMLGKGKKDKIFTGQNSSSYALISTLQAGYTQGENRNPGYYVQNRTKRKIRGEDFVWLSSEPETYISFGSNAGGKFNARIGLELCISSSNPS